MSAIDGTAPILGILRIAACASAARRTRALLRRGIPVVLFATALVGSSTLAVGPGDPKLPAPLVLEEQLVPLPVTLPLDEARADRQHALALFSTARVLERRDDFAGAIRLYQRAFRYDPQPVLVHKVIALAADMRRWSEAVRYSLKAAELDELDPEIVRRLALRQARQQDFELAEQLIKKALKVRDAESAEPNDAWLWLDAGRVFVLADKPTDAAREFARVLDAIDHPEELSLDDEQREKLVDDFSPILGVVGEMFLDVKQYDRAADAFRRARHAKTIITSPSDDPGGNQTSDDDADAAKAALLEYHLARIDAARGRTEKAMARLNKVLGLIDDEGTAPCAFLAELLDKLDRSEELVARLDALRRENPDEPAITYFLAQTYFDADRLDLAEKLYRELSDETPTLTTYRQLVRTYHKQQDVFKLVDLLGKVAEQTATLEALGEPIHAVLEDAAMVTQLLAEADRRYRDDPATPSTDVRRAMALVALDADRLAEATRWFDSAIESSADGGASILLDWGRALFLGEHYERASEVFGRGSDVAADDEMVIEFRHYQAASLAMAGRYEDALLRIDEALKLDATSLRLLNRRAWILSRAGRLEEASVAYRELIEKYDTDHDSNAVRMMLRDARLALSAVAVSRSDFDESEELLQQVLDEFPDDIAALNDLGYLWADRSLHLSRAEKMIRRALRGDPENAAYLDSLGWILHRLGRDDEALRTLTRAVELEPDPIMLEHVGDVRLALDQPDAARDAYRRALEALEGAYEESYQGADKDEIIGRLKDKVK